MITYRDYHTGWDIFTAVTDEWLFFFYQENSGYMGNNFQKFCSSNYYQVLKYQTLKYEYNVSLSVKTKDFRKAINFSLSQLFIQNLLQAEAKQNKIYSKYN